MLPRIHHDLTDLEPDLRLRRVAAAQGAQPRGELNAIQAVKGAQARERGIELDVMAHGDVPPSMAGDLVTALGNLIDNALEACGVGDRITVEITRTGDVVRAVVDDTGPGVPDDMARRIFEEGVSTKQTGARGRGIGLALVRRVARRRGGDVRVIRSPAGGARFILHLPSKQKAERR